MEITVGADVTLTRHCWLVVAAAVPPVTFIENVANQDEGPDDWG